MFPPVIELQLVPVLGTCIPTNKQDEFRFCCPRCVARGKKTPDREHHLFVNPVKEKFICQRCKFKGPLSFLLSYLKIESTLAVSVENWEEKLNHLLNPEDRATEVSDDEEVPCLPDDYIPVFPGSDAERYLMGRGFPHDEIAQRQVGFGCAKHKGLLIFPEFDEDGCLLYWTSKSYSAWRKRPLNCDASKAGYMYWLAHVPGNAFVVTTEGVFDAIIFGDHGTALLGSVPTREQIQALLDRDFECYYIALDGEARQEQRALAHTLWQEDKTVRVLRFPWREDPNSLGRQSVAGYLARSVPYSPDNALLVELGE